MQSPNIMLLFFSVVLFFPVERSVWRSLILNYSLRVMKQSQYMQNAPHDVPSR